MKEGSSAKVLSNLSCCYGRQEDEKLTISYHSSSVLKNIDAKNAMSKNTKFLQNGEIWNESQYR